MPQRHFFDEFDAMAETAFHGILKRARQYVAAGAIENSEEIDDLREVKAALCAALCDEAEQWRFRGEVSATEKNLRSI